MIKKLSRHYVRPLSSDMSKFWSANVRWPTAICSPVPHWLCSWLCLGSVDCYLLTVIQNEEARDNLQNFCSVTECQNFFLNRLYTVKVISIILCFYCSSYICLLHIHHVIYQYYICRTHNWPAPNISRLHRSVGRMHPFNLQRSCMALNDCN